MTIAVPAGSGYLLSSKSSGRTFAVVDSEFVEKEIFRQIPRQDGKLILAVTHNTTYYAAADATCAAGGGRTAWMPPPAIRLCSARILPTRLRL